MKPEDALALDYIRRDGPASMRCTRCDTWTPFDVNEGTWIDDEWTCNDCAARAEKEVGT